MLVLKLSPGELDMNSLKKKNTSTSKKIDFFGQL